MLAPLAACFHQQVCKSEENVIKSSIYGNELQKGKNMLFDSFLHISFPMQLKFMTQFMKIKAELEKE